MIYPWPFDDTNEPNPDEQEELEEIEDDSWQDRAYDLWADK